MDYKKQLKNLVCEMQAICKDNKYDKSEKVNKLYELSLKYDGGLV